MGYNLNLKGDGINCFGLESDPNEGGHVARRGLHIQLKLELGQKRNWGKNSPISWFDREREESQGFLPRSMKFRWSVFVWLRTKVHHFDKGYAWVPRNRDFAKDPRREISENRGCLV